NDPAVIHDPTADPRPVCQRVQCHGNLPPLISSTGVRNYPVNYDHPFAIWRDLEHYCNSWGSSNLFHDPGGAGCSCVLPGHPAYVLLPVNSHPICRGGAYNIPGYDAFAFNNAPATELCRQVCTCVDAPQISPPDLSRVEPNQPRIVPQGPVRPQDPVRPQRGPIDPNHPQVVPS
ncbi:MAG: hypothetical protein M1830_005244, partial [Pleopsidium flavum]